ncbi:MAG: Maf family nucleotide pyrophosphatase [Bacteroidales bacterium]|jgi:septum formation protein|nr:Maf family nucleotide pyrophosphatase [Bacteroidales bacterium]
MNPPLFPVYQLPLVLASKSPRRAELLRQAGFRFTTCDADNADESYPEELQGAEIPLYLAELKSDAFMRRYTTDNDTVVITADTIVWLQGKILGKPAGRDDTIRMLASLSGNMHQVFTGVCLASAAQKHLFCAESKVWFKELSAGEIAYYADACHPFDKAGAYGIQEWIGCVGIERIEGSYFNVVGLPVQQLYVELHRFIAH